ncbi:MAG TPA: hypothetical protein VLC09_09435 [Polyangiaceae bacterium]|nr:hypothetical protein [Polyangiaceae bacterium]
MKHFFSLFVLPRSAAPSSSTRAFARIRLGALLAFVLLTASVAWAGNYAYVAHHVTKKSPEHVISVLTSYGNVCNQGCKYYGPDVKEFIQISHKKTATSWYTWTWVSTTLRDVKYFNKVTQTTKPDGTILMVTRLLDESDKALVDELVKATGKPHGPAFDSGKTVFVIRKQDDGTTKVTQDMSMTASGMIDMFGDKIREGMKAGAAATFKNIEQ